MLEAMAATTQRRFLCRLDEIDDGEGRGFVLGAGTERLEVLLVRDDGFVHGYVNACPHAGTPLDWQPDRFMSPDGTYLQCHTHGALFRIDDGYCVAGPCAGQSLTRLDVEVDGAGGIWLMTASPRTRGG